MPVSHSRELDPRPPEVDPAPPGREDLLRDPLADPLEDGEAIQCDGRAQAVRGVAAQGTKGSAGSLPFQSQIQASFGEHDVSGVKAFTDDKAKEATAAMGANAYAKGDKVVFGEGASNLHTAAHEATHILQQRAGLKPPGGVGSPGDPLEQQADAVADEVVQGHSAAPLLDKIGKG